ncbi:protein S100-A12-like [Phaenicophaeus curvirostris]|uniref:protein S100-A12-like n=1 Tax=Phaenicophaeus curvirostris TaxID=33595 RepID=UPI0037F0CA05
MKSDLELALECMVNIYHEYAPKDRPIDDYLNKREFSDLMRNNAQAFLADTRPPNTSEEDYIEKLFARADSDHDGCLRFTEFLTTLNLVYIDAHNRSHKHSDVGHGHGHDHGHQN